MKNKLKKEIKVGDKYFNFEGGTLNMWERTAPDGDWDERPATLKDLQETIDQVREEERERIIKLIGEWEERFDKEEEIRQISPTIKMKGWWWKKYFKKYRIQKSVMEKEMENWLVENYDEFQEEITRRIIEKLNNS